MNHECLITFLFWLPLGEELPPSPRICSEWSCGTAPISASRRTNRYRAPTPIIWRSTILSITTGWWTTRLWRGAGSRWQKWPGGGEVEIWPYKAHHLLHADHHQQELPCHPQQYPEHNLQNQVPLGSEHSLQPQSQRHPAQQTPGTVKRRQTCPTKSSWTQPSLPDPQSNKDVTQLFSKKKKKATRWF